MKNISDIIENHLKRILEQAKKDYIEIQRSELASQFQCVPSQINYVINTRFTLEKGYIVESKRGGGGFIRIRKIQFVTNQAYLENILNLLEKEEEITQNTAENIIEQLLETEIVSTREARIMFTVIQRDILSFHVPVRDQLRAKILKSMLQSIMYK